MTDPILGALLIIGLLWVLSGILGSRPRNGEDDIEVAADTDPSLGELFLLSLALTYILAWLHRRQN